ncbi:hypothetical protein CgunFtcFv8_015171 [Champsocephalus gunnari]|uniref:Uncharacterized protein n=1 Tax=Champsocephalus gunnari TaxID=52237 RepID=A0AAN8C5X5_CHAGU|nr:hypothetical protein CgunFtcFv8_015171 [Champsocephalus gunnari]
MDFATTAPDPSGTCVSDLPSPFLAARAREMTHHHQRPCFLREGLLFHRTPEGLRGKGSIFPPAGSVCSSETPTASCLSQRRSVFGPRSVSRELKRDPYFLQHRLCVLCEGLLSRDDSLRFLPVFGDVLLLI